MTRTMAEHLNFTKMVRGDTNHGIGKVKVQLAAVRVSTR